jgi:hypothetical protein
MKKSFAQYRQEAANLNEQAREQGQSEPIPDYSSMRLRPLARAVLQARVDAHNSSVTQSSEGVEA